MTPYVRGDVVWHPAPFREGGRPFVVMSDEHHPFHGEEYLAVGVTTTERDLAIPLDPASWIEGSPPKPSWASPWYVLTVKHATITDRVGRLVPSVTGRIADEVASLVGCSVP